MTRWVFIMIFFASLLIGPPVGGQTRTDYSLLVDHFRNPPPEARPKAYWWCLNGNIDTVRAREEFRAMKENGLTGFDLFEIGVPDQDTMIPGGPAFMSDESVQRIKWVIDEAGKLDLTVGLNLASSWNAGGSWVVPRHGGKSLYRSKITIQGEGQSDRYTIPFPEITIPRESLVGGDGKPMIPFRSDGRPVYYEEIAVLAIPVLSGDEPVDTADIIDVTPYFDAATDVLEWTSPPGDWDIFRFVTSNSGQQLVLASPLSAGLTIDHFDSTAVETHLMHIIDRLQSVLGDFRKTALRSFYLASYEARGLVWTPTLPDEFQELHGYSIRKYLPIFFDPDILEKELTLRVLTDFRKTLSELMIHNLYEKSKEICNRYGLKINSEAGGPGYPLYNGPAEPLKALGSLDIPRGEFWVNHSRFYQDGTDSIDVLRVVKEVSAASHIYQRKFVEEEAFSSFQHWQEGPFDMKPFADRAFCEGMNRVVFHGFSHNITGSGYPGFVYHAGTHFNDKRVWWSRAKPFVDYLSRISAVFQNSDFVADVLWYYGDKVPNSATAKNTHFEVGPGYDYEVINTEILIHDLSVQDGKLVLSNGAEFSVLALEPEATINPHVLQKLDELVMQGARIVGARPRTVNISDHAAKNGTLDGDLISKLWDTGSNSDDPKIHSELSSLEMLSELGIDPDIHYAGVDSGLIDYIHFRKNEIGVYFIRNTTSEWLSREVGFRQPDRVPEIWDPVTGEMISLRIYKLDGDYCRLPLTLPPYGSQMLIFKPRNSDTESFQITGSDRIPPLIDYRADGIIFLEEGEFELVGGDRSIDVDHEIPIDTIQGTWEISFTPGWGAPEKEEFPHLMSWTESRDEGIRYYSGTATYTKSFQYDPASKSGENDRIFLDLGEISKVGELWLNGQNLGISWTSPHRFDITDDLVFGKNTMKVAVANTWSNRLTGDALTGSGYTNTNIRRTIIPSEGIETGDQTRYDWAEVPLIESGLLGPVTIRVMEVVDLVDP